MQNVMNAIDAMRDNRMILLYDAADREGETDLVMPAKSITAHDIAYMRTYGGGLLCAVIPDKAAERFRLPFMADILRQIPDLAALAEGDLPYDARSSFSVWVNHRTTYTGITDRDRALTMRKLDEIVESALHGDKISFSSEFRSPGHVAVLRGAKNLLKERKGQTELSIALAELADINPVLCICEMLDSDTGYALKREDAKKYASKNGLVFVDGEEVVSMYETG
ncbi:3,4-dihydroxy-2-butanone-4-phosphate synthase [ANME-2 cluster archaeon]|nr:MAG: 3,4-dihydroxy-2-butanone-4-phosphate synthase [ANME-2 cluster archaeon]